MAGWLAGCFSLHILVSYNIASAQTKVSRRSSIFDITIVDSVVVPETGMVEPGLLSHCILNLEEGIQLTPTVLAVAALRETLAKRQRTLVEDEVNILGFFAIIEPVSFG